MKADPPPIVGRCSYVAFFRERGETYQAIAKRCGVSRARVQQLFNKHKRMSLANALHAIHARTYMGGGVQVFNKKETAEIIGLLKEMAAA